MRLVKEAASGAAVALILLTLAAIAAKVNLRSVRSDDRPAIEAPPPTLPSAEEEEEAVPMPQPGQNPEIEIEIAPMPKEIPGAELHPEVNKELNGMEALQLYTRLALEARQRLKGEFVKWLPEDRETVEELCKEIAEKAVGKDSYDRMLAAREVEAKDGLTSELLAAFVTKAGHAVVVHLCTTVVDPQTVRVDGLRIHGKKSHRLTLPKTVGRPRIG